MGGLRALTRVHKVKKFDERPKRFNHDERKTTHVTAEISLVNLTQEQENRKKLNLSYDILPTTRDQLASVLKIEDNSKHPEDGVLIKLQKLRDYFNPLLNENKKYEEDYQRFLLAMLLLWIKLSSEKSVIHKQVLAHLREVASTERYAGIFVEYMRDQMMILAKILETLSQEKVTSEQACKILGKLHRLQQVYVRVLECPAGKLMDCLLQLCGQTYTQLNSVLTQTSVVALFVQVLKNDLACMQNQESKAAFNPILQMACQRLPVDHKLRHSYIEFLQERVMHPQITSSCLVQTAVEGPRLEYLQLAKQKPRAISSLKALIEDDFMLIERKWKAPLDEKTLKRKIKAEEKMTIRELKKDTLILQQEKLRIKQMKISKNKKRTFRGGNAPVNEV